MQVKKDIKQKLFILAVTIILFLIAALLQTVCELGEKQSETRKMDARELQYDADGDFIMVDIQSGLCGVYRACTPLRHIWIGESRPDPGVYILEHKRGQIILHERNNPENAQVLRLDPEEAYWIINNISYKSPVLVY